MNTPAFKRAEFSSQISKDQNKVKQAFGNVGILVYLIKRQIPVLYMFQQVSSMYQVLTHLFSHLNLQQKLLLTSIREARAIQPNVLKILLLISKQFNRKSVHGTYILLHIIYCTIWLFFISLVT